jgi:hypothetical protein
MIPAIYNCRLSFIDRPLPARGQQAFFDLSLAIVARCLIIFLVAVCFSVVCLSTSALAQAWPQILGIHRDGSAPSLEGLSTKWPAAIAPTWQARIGSGYGGAAISGDRVFVLHRLENQEFVEALERSTGQTLWRTAWNTDYRSSINPDNGPRCVPVIAGERVLGYGAAGDLACVDLASGKLLWHRPLRAEFDADDGYFGAGSTPLVVGDIVLVCLGGAKGGIVAIDLPSGNTRWTATDYDASYASPIAVTPHTALVVTRLKTVLIELSNGSILSEIDFGSRGPTVNAATPLRIGSEQILLTASYGVGATLLNVANGRLTPEFRGSTCLSSQYNTPVMTSAHLIGIDGREDVGLASLQAVDLSQERIIWKQPDFGTAHLLASPSRVLTLTLDGKLQLIDGRADKFMPLASTQLPAGTYRALPALAGNQLVVRDTDQSNGSSRLITIDLPTE